MGSLDAGKADRLCPVCLFRTFGCGEISEFFPVHEKLFLVFSLFPLRQSLLCLRWSLEHERFGGPPGGGKTGTDQQLLSFSYFSVYGFFFFVPRNTFRFAEIT